MNGPSWFCATALLSQLALLTACTGTFMSDSNAACGASMRCVIPPPPTRADCLANNNETAGWAYEWHEQPPAPSCPRLKECKCFRCIKLEVQRTQSTTKCALRAGECSSDFNWRRTCGEDGNGMRIDEQTGEFVNPWRAGQCVAQFTVAAQQHALKFQTRVGIADKISRANAKVCLTSLLGGYNPWYFIGHSVFMRALVSLEKGFDAPFIAVDGCVGQQLTLAQREDLRRLYTQTLIYRPLIPTWKSNRTGNVFHFPPLLERTEGHQRVVNASALDIFTTMKLHAFYLRLQVIFFSSCPTVVQVDTSDMLPVAPFMTHTLRMASTYGFAAAPLCRYRLPYFNAGLFAIGRHFLEQRHSATAFVELMLLAHAPPCADGYLQSMWFADQSVLNIFFHDKAYLALPMHFNFDHRFDRQCSERPTVIHYIGPSKPWASSSSILKNSTNLHEAAEVRRSRQLWWQEYLRDKTVVVGQGPSVRAPYGKYIDMFANVIRINDFKLAGPNETGTRTTHVFLHKATRGTHSLRAALAELPRERLLFSSFGESTSVLEARMQQQTGTQLRLAQVTMLGPYYDSGLVADMGLALGTRPATSSGKLPHPLTGTIALTWCLRNTVPRPIYAIGFDMTLGRGKCGHTTDKYEHYTAGGSHPTASHATSKRSLAMFHHVEADRAFLHALCQNGTIQLLDNHHELPLR
mmetsp:Transcript_21419/g.55141  ORF Transcript_21419/g.55141 Transcript_21419/m.55141 type:complete len:692 (+) Transcript_21419:3-2078(+)